MGKKLGYRKVPNVVIISDTQAPFAHQDALDFIAAVIEKVGPKHIYHVGDEADLHTISRWASNPDAPGPRDEFERAKAWLDSLEKICPNLRLCWSNHAGRIFKQAARVGIGDYWIKSPQSAYSKRRWKWAPSWTVKWAQGECLVYHGQRKKGGINRAKRISKSVICGHWHSLSGVSWFRADRNLCFGMDVGCLIDEHSPAFDYAEEAEYQQILSLGAIIDGWPRVFPMECDSKGRWTQRLV